MPSTPPGRRRHARRHLRVLLAGLALLLLGAPAPLCAQSGRGKRREQQHNTLARFQSWWKLYTRGQIDLRGSSRNPSEGARARSQAANLFREVAASLGVPAGANILWKAALYRVDLEANRGFQALRAQPWFVRRSARRAIASLPPEALLGWLAKRASKGHRVRAASPRLAVAEILALLGGARVKPLLLRILARASAPERVEVLADLAQALPGDEEAIAAVLAQLRASDPNLRTAAAHALGRTVGGRMDETVRTDARSKAPAALAAGLAAQVVAALGERLENDYIWSVRKAAAAALARLRNRAAIAALIRGLEMEVTRRRGERRPELLSSMEATLRELTGQDIPAGKVDWWRRWWKREGCHAELRAPSEKGSRRRSRGGARYASYFNLRITSDRILFIVDRSGSMAEPAQVHDEYGRPLRAKGSKFAFVQDELEKLVRALPQDAFINVLFFSDEVKIWSTPQGDRPRLHALKPRAKNDLIEFIRGIHPVGGTNLYGALDRALGFAGRGLFDKYYKTAFDTIYLLSDGKPTVGQVLEPAEILRHVREVNRLRQITIHTITFGDRNNARFMARLAAESGGQHVHIN